MSTRQDIIAEVKSRLEAIAVANGYQTDAGALVYVGQAPGLSDADPEQALALLVGADDTGYQGENVLVTASLFVHALVRADVDDPYLASEAAIADIKKAVETDHDLAGLLPPRGLERGSTTSARREQGSEYVAAVVEYRVRFLEKWGAP